MLKPLHKGPTGGGYKPMDELAPKKTPLDRPAETIQERLKKQWEKRQEEINITAKDEKRYAENRERVLRNRMLDDGVFIWTETKGTGHTFVSIHKDAAITVFTYGRYGAVDKSGSTGEGILVKLLGKEASKYIQKKTYETGAKAFKILDAPPTKVFQHFNAMWTSSNTPPQKRSGQQGAATAVYGRVIDNYNLLNNNCTTHSVDAVKAAGSQIFTYDLLSIELTEGFTIPYSLERHLTELSHNFEMLVIDVSADIRIKHPNEGGIKPKEDVGTKQEILGAAAKGSGYIGG